PVKIFLEDGSEFTETGRLTHSEVSVDPTTGRTGLRVVVPNPDHVLLPGMYVHAVIGLGVRESAILVPQQGITREATGEASAKVVATDGTVEMRPVVVSRTIGNKWLVESGLGAGGRVVLKGLQKVRPGVRVEVSEERGNDAAVGTST